MPASKKITQPQAMQDLKESNHQITFGLAKAMVKDYKRFRTEVLKAKKSDGLMPASTPQLPVFLTYNNAAINKLLKTPGCVALRMYFAINTSSQLTLVITGVDEAGDNIVEAKQALSANRLKFSAKSATITLLDEGQASPPYPAPSNDF